MSPPICQKESIARHTQGAIGKCECTRSVVVKLKVVIIRTIVHRFEIRNVFQQATAAGSIRKRKAKCSNLRLSLTSRGSSASSKGVQRVWYMVTENNRPKRETQTNVPSKTFEK